MKEILFFFTSVHRDFFSRLQAKHFWQCCQKCILRVHRIILRKNTFCRRKNMFFIFFGLWNIFLPLFQLFGWIVKTAFQRSKCISRKLFSKVFLLLLGMGQKFWSFVEEFLAGLSIFILRVHGNFLRKNLFFGKNRFFSIIFGLCVNFFSVNPRVSVGGFVITACYVSKCISGKIIFFEEKFFTLSDNER